VFFGTPHRGSRVASRVKRLATFINAFLISIPEDIFKSLQAQSKELNDISKQSVQRLADLTILSVVEKKPLAIMPFRNGLVRTKDLLSVTLLFSLT
jgi:hypothetical protein